MCLSVSCAMLQIFVSSLRCQHLITVFIKITISGLFSKKLGPLAAWGQIPAGSDGWCRWHLQPGMLSVSPLSLPGPAPMSPVPPCTAETALCLHARDHPRQPSSVRGKLLALFGPDEGDGLCPLTACGELLKPYSKAPFIVLKTAMIFFVLCR